GFKYKLLSISQFCDNEFIVSFDKDSCIVKRSDDTTLFIIKRNNNCYKINLEDLNRQNFNKKNRLRYLGKHIFFARHAKKGNKSKHLSNKKNIVSTSRHKRESFNVFEIFCKKTQNEKNFLYIYHIRSGG
ncbi:hypothetical protein CR513_46353, partial [Mucuna pruriens]